MKAIILMILVVLTLQTYAEEGELEANEKLWSITLNQSILDKYIFRGLVLNREGVYQGIMDARYDTGDYGVYAFNLWYNVDLDNENGEAGNMTETDYTFYWEKSLEDFTLAVGHFYYDFSEAKLGSTREFWGMASFHTLFSPTIQVYYDYVDVDGLYVDLGISHSFDLGVLDSSLDLKANIGWADEDTAEFYYGSDSGFSNYILTAAVNFPLPGNVTITPSINYYALLGDANESVTGKAAKDDDFVYGITVTFSF